MSEASDGFAVDLDHLDLVTTQIRGFAGFVADQLAALEAQAKTVSGLWTGAAASAYDEAHREWVEGALEVKSGAEKMETAARAAHGNYGAATTSNRKMFNV